MNHRTFIFLNIIVLRHMWPFLGDCLVDSLNLLMATNGSANDATKKLPKDIHHKSSNYTAQKK